MFESRAVSEPTQELSRADRLHLVQTLNALPKPQFDELVFALAPPPGNIPSNPAAQSDRSTALLAWAESPIGPGLLELEKILGSILATHTKMAEQFTAFVISGKISNTTTAEIQAFVQLLRKKTGDDSIDVAFFMEGSIKIILSGSPEGLEKLQEMFESGELEDLEIPPVEEIYRVDNDTTDARKARHIKALRLRQPLVPLASDNIPESENVRFRYLNSKSIRNLSIKIELRQANLRGANLRRLDLRKIDLTDADLTDADVTGTLFGNNPGLTEEIKHDLQQRGALFLDPPSSDVPSLVLR